MSKLISRREALRNIFLAGVGVSAAGTLGPFASARGRESSASLPYVEAPEGSKVDRKHFASLGEDISMLGLGCMRLPQVQGQGPGGFGRGRLDQEAVNEMIDYAIAHGINYFDTAPAYGESEVVTGNALKRHPRESFMIATKMSNMAFGPNANPTLEAAKTMFETSLKNLQVDYVDFLLLHNVSSESEFETRFIKNGVLDYIKDMKAQGKIRHLGFSFHGDNASLPKLLEKYPWEFVQIQLNYVDWGKMEGGFGPRDSGETSAEVLYNTLVERNIPVLVMEPVKGGALANVTDAIAARLKERHPSLTPATNALSFVGSLPGVMVTLSGMSNMDQLKENVALFTNFKPFGKEDMDFMLEVADLYKSNVHIPCTACAYCMPCPQGVDIPGNFRVFNRMSDNLSIPDPEHKGPDFEQKKNAYLELYDKELAAGTKADQCIGCNVCVPKCPQRIPISTNIQMIRDMVAKL